MKKLILILISAALLFMFSSCTNDISNDIDYYSNLDENKNALADEIVRTKLPEIENDDHIICYIVRDMGDSSPILTVSLRYHVYNLWFIDASSPFYGKYDIIDDQLFLYPYDGYEEDTGDEPYVISLSIGEYKSLLLDPEQTTPYILDFFENQGIDRHLDIDKIIFSIDIRESS